MNQNIIDLNKFNCRYPTDIMGKYSIENLLRFTDRGASNLATSLLDEIVSRDEVDKQNPLYKLANLKKAGTLIERYLLEGQKELESIATSEIRKYMYRDGEGEEMNMGTKKEVKTVLEFKTVSPILSYLVFIGSLIINIEIML